MLTLTDLAQLMAARPSILAAVGLAAVGLAAVGLAAVVSIARGAYTPTVQAIRARNEQS